MVLEMPMPRRTMKLADWTGFEARAPGGCTTRIASGGMVLRRRSSAGSIFISSAAMSISRSIM